jgi:mono/diheme cytochrome c family protein
MFRRILAALVVLAVVVAAAFWFLTRPQRLDPSVIADLQPGDAARGEAVFWAAGCESCHAAPEAKGDDKLKLGGGVKLATDFGTFVAPNISSDPQDGIGGWSLEDFANAVMRGVTPGGHHLYPALPYTSYTRMDPQDVADLFAFIKTLPAVEGRQPGPDLSFPYNIRRGVGLWKLLYLDDSPVVALPADASDAVKRGQYLVEGPGQCGECHTPRDFAGGSQLDQWLAGAPAVEGKGVVPNITPSEDGLADWSAEDIAYYLETGFTPDFDSVGGDMVAVQENIAKLSDADRQAIAAYLKAVPPRPNGYPARKKDKE